MITNFIPWAFSDSKFYPLLMLQVSTSFRMKFYLFILPQILCKAILCFILHKSIIRKYYKVGVQNLTAQNQTLMLCIMDLYSTCNSYADDSNDSGHSANARSEVATGIKYILPGSTQIMHKRQIWARGKQNFCFLSTVFNTNIKFTRTALCFYEEMRKSKNFCPLKLIISSYGIVFRVSLHWFFFQ